MDLKKIISWNKYKSEVTIQPKSNKLDYMIDPTFKNTNRLFFQLLKVGNYDFTKNYFVNYYMPLIKIKVSNALIENKPFFEQPV